jgi:hypothetical protein
MPYIPFTEEEKLRANTVDLPAFLQMRGEKLKRVGREYKLVYSDETGLHDSITISGSTWFDHKNQVGGGAIRFMQHRYKLSFTQAVQTLLGGKVPTFYNAAKYVENKKSGGISSYQRPIPICIVCTPTSSASVSSAPKLSPILQSSTRSTRMRRTTMPCS